MYALGTDRVLRIYRSGHEGPARDDRPARGTLRGWSASGSPFELPPSSTTARSAAGGSASIDGWPARASSAGCPVPRSTPRRQALLGYLDAAGRVQHLRPPWRACPAARRRRAPAVRLPRRAAQRPAAADHAAEPGPARARRARCRADLGRAAGVARRPPGRPRLVHGDFCPPNTYVAVQPDGRPVITGVGDFSPHTLLADPMMDIAGAVMFLELEPMPAQPRTPAGCRTGDRAVRSGPAAGARHLPAASTASTSPPPTRSTRICTPGAGAAHPLTATGPVSAVDRRPFSHLFWRHPDPDVFKALADRPRGGRSWTPCSTQDGQTLRSCAARFSGHDPVRRDEASRRTGERRPRGHRCGRAGSSGTSSTRCPIEQIANRWISRYAAQFTSALVKLEEQPSNT